VEGRALAEYRLARPTVWGVIVTWDEDLGLAVPSTRTVDVSFCGVRRARDGGLCGISAGAGTAHLGVGACWMHDDPTERVSGAWIVAHAMARIEDITPWEALLLAVKRAAAWTAFYEGKVAEVTDDEDLRPGGEAHDWVVALERVNDKLARYSKMAVDAGVAQMLVQRARTEGETIARVLNLALGEAGLSDEQETILRGALRRALLAVEEPPSVTGS
jgi:hypothetical protein